MHIVLGADSTRLPVCAFFGFAGASGAITPVPRAGQPAAALNIYSHKDNGEFVIGDQYNFRHPEWQAIPIVYNTNDKPVILIGKLGNSFHCRLSSESGLRQLDPQGAIFELGSHYNTHIITAPDNILRAFHII